MKKLGYFFIVIICCFQVSLFATGEQESSLGKKEVVITLEMWDIFGGDPQNSHVNELVDMFIKKHPEINVSRTTFEQETYQSVKLPLALGTDNPPDIFFVWAMPAFLGRFVQEGLILDSTATLRTAMEDIMPAAGETVIYNDKIYAAPFFFTGKLIQYNRRLFNEFGLNEPKTWDELMKVCETLKQNGISPFVLGNKAKWPANHFISIFNQKCVGLEKAMDIYLLKSGNFLEPGFVTALEYLQELYAKNYFYPGINATSYDESLMIFGQEKAAMMDAGTWAFAHMLPNLPDDFQYGVFPWPVFPEPGDKGYLDAWGHGIAASAKTKYPKEVMEFQKFWMSREAGMHMAKNDMFPIVPMSGVYKEENVHPELWRYFQWMDDVEKFVPCYDNCVNYKIREVWENGIQAMLDGRMEPEEIMKNVEKQARSLKEQ